MTSRLLAVKNWNEFQHYKKRNPPWIKMHRAILDDYTFLGLPDVCKSHLMHLWLFASQNNGLVPYDVAFLERKLFLSNLDLDRLINAGFLIEPGAKNTQAGG